ncbi:MAG TPA: hypothetical protein PLA75_04930 [Bacteroidales bacterium]|nr:hypothetical protein [Bacteroidales bacterium]
MCLEHTSSFAARRRARRRVGIGGAALLKVCLSFVLSRLFPFCNNFNV